MTNLEARMSAMEDQMGEVMSTLEAFIAMVTLRLPLPPPRTNKASTN